MPVDATTCCFQEVVTHDLNSFLSDLIWNTAAMWGLSQSGLANWVYSMAPSMHGRSLKPSTVIGAATKARRLLLRYGFPLGANDRILVRL